MEKSEVHYCYWVRFAARAASFLLFFRAVLTALAFYYTQSSVLQVQWSDAALDFLKACTNQWLLGYALKAPTAQHPFGYGKAEHLWALFQGGLLFFATVMLTWTAASALCHPVPIANFVIGESITLVCAFLMSLLCLLQWKVACWTSSPAIWADFLHNSGDLLGYGLVLCSLALSAMGWIWAEPLLALLMSAHLLTTAVRMMKEAVKTLCDRCLPPSECDAIREVVTQMSAGVLHRLRCRRSGPVRFIELQIELEAELSVAQVSAGFKTIQSELARLFPVVDVVCQLYMPPIRRGGEGSV